MSFCSVCGKKIENNVLFCSFCGARVSATTAQPPPDAALPTDEEIMLAQSPCQFGKGKGIIALHGRVVITNRRILYFQHNIAAMLAIGYAVHFSKGEFHTEIPLAAVSMAALGRHMGNDVIRITTAAGELYRIYPMNLRACMEALTGCLPQVPFV